MQNFYQQECVRLLITPAYGILPANSDIQSFPVTIEARVSEEFTPMRMPLNMCFVGDISGSMVGTKLEAMKDSVCACIDQMDEDDVVSVVVFDDEAYVIISAQKIGKDKGRLKKKVAGIISRGSTCISPGLQKGLKELKKHGSSEYINRLYLLADGDTQGDRKECYRQAKIAKERNIPIIPLGIGANWEEEVLDKIGRNSGSKEAEHIKTARDAKGIFLAELHVAQTIAITNASLIIKPMMGTELAAVTKTLPQISSLESLDRERQCVIPLGDLSKGISQEVLAQFTIAKKVAQPWQIAKATLIYDIPAYGMFQQQMERKLILVFDYIDGFMQENPSVLNTAEAVGVQAITHRMLENSRNVTLTKEEKALLTKHLDNETLQAVTQIEKGGSLSSEQAKVVKNKTRKLTQRLDNLL